MSEWVLGAVLGGRRGVWRCGGGSGTHGCVDGWLCQRYLQIQRKAQKELASSLSEDRTHSQLFPFLVRQTNAAAAVKQQDQAVEQPTTQDGSVTQAQSTERAAQPDSTVVSEMPSSADAASSAVDEGATLPSPMGAATAHAVPCQQTTDPPLSVSPDDVCAAPT